MFLVFNQLGRLNFLITDQCYITDSFHFSTILLNSPAESRSMSPFPSKFDHSFTARPFSTKYRITGFLSACLNLNILISVSMNSLYCLSHYCSNVAFWTCSSSFGRYFQANSTLCLKFCRLFSC